MVKVLCNGPLECLLMCHAIFIGIKKAILVNWKICKFRGYEYKQITMWSEILKQSLLIKPQDSFGIWQTKTKKQKKK